MTEKEISPTLSRGFIVGVLALYSVMGTTIICSTAFAWHFVVNASGAWRVVGLAAAAVLTAIAIWAFTPIGNLWRNRA